MYSRSYGKRRPPTLPDNYCGNAFSGVPAGEPLTDISPAKLPEPEEAPLAPGGKLFPNGIGNEELLLLSSILTASESGDGNGIVPYLILLLFC